MDISKSNRALSLVSRRNASSLALTLLAPALAGLAGCGTASINYSPALDSTPGNAKTIVSRAAAGGQTISLPVSRLVIQASIVSDSETESPVASNDQSDSPAAAAKGPDKHTAGKKKPNKPAADKPAADKPAADKPKADKPAKKGSDAASAPAGISTTLTGTDGQKYVVNIVQIEGPVSFNAVAVNDFWSENDFGVSRLANTNVATNVSNTFTDQTAARVKTAISLVTAIAGAAGLAAGPNAGEAEKGVAPTPACGSRTVVLDLSRPSTKTDSSETWAAPDTSDASARCYVVTVVAQRGVDHVGKDLISIETFKDGLSGNSADWSGRVWPVPACMDVTVSITSASSPGGAQGSPTQGEIRVIDPDYIAVFPVPKKGKIAMQPVCGADYSDAQSDKYQSFFDTMTAISSAIPKKPAAAKK